MTNPGDSPRTDAVDGGGAPSAAVIAFLSGAGVLALEVTGARVFIPWFGSSNLVWTNVIGVTLGSVAVGNFLGGRVADRGRNSHWLAGLLFGAALMTALVPFETPFLARRYLPPGLPLDVAFALIDRASLVVAICALGPPLVLLGAATPFLMRRAVRENRVGRAAGVISAAGTAGSLLGTWGPVHYLIPTFGSRATCLIAAATLCAGGVIAGLSAKRGRLSLRRYGWIAPLLLILVAVGTRGDVGRVKGGDVVAEVETLYQYARVEDDGERISLKLNEGLDSFHSVTVRGELMTGVYFDYYGLYVPLAAREKKIDVLILGFAAGTIARQILDAYGDSYEVSITGVELDPAVVALGRKWFDLPQDDRVEIVANQDARIFLRATNREFDYVVVDTYASQVYVPFQVCSREFFAAARSRLRPGGILAANLSGYTLEDEPLRAIRNTAAAVFGDVSMLKVTDSRNYVLAMRRDGGAPDVRVGEPAPPFRRLIERLRPASFRTYAFDDRERVLTDDLSPIEQMYDRDLSRKAKRQLARSEEG